VFGIKQRALRVSAQAVYALGSDMSTLSVACCTVRTSMMRLWCKLAKALCLFLLTFCLCCLLSMLAAAHCIAAHASWLMQELDVAYSELCDHFFVIASGEDIMPSMAWVLEKAKAAKIQ
jgi:hypothetical protein